LSFMPDSSGRAHQTGFQALWKLQRIPQAAAFRSVPNDAPAVIPYILSG